MEAAAFADIARGAEEVRVVVQSARGETRTPIWIVTVGDGTFVRSYRAAQGRWYQHVRATRRFPLEVAGRDIVVDAIPVADDELLRQVSTAYLAKYAGQPETPDMVTAPVAATTLRLVPAPGPGAAG